MNSTVKGLKHVIVGISAALLVMGICLILWPGISTVVICRIVAAGLMILGIIKTVLYFYRNRWGIPNYLERSSGILDITISLMLLIHPEDAILILPIVLGILILINSVFVVHIAVQMKSIGLGNWIYLLILGILGIAAGLFLVLNPFTGAKTLTILLGAALVLEGLENLCVVRYLRKLWERHAPIEGSYVDLDV